MADAVEAGIDPTSADSAAISLTQLADGAQGMKSALTATAPNAVSGNGTPSFSIGNFLSDAYNGVRSAVEQGYKDLSSFKEQNQTVTDDQMIASHTQYDATVQKNEADMRAKLMENQDIGIEAARNGVTPGHFSAIMAAAANDIQENLKDFTARSADIRERNKVGFFDDPVQWLVNQAVIPFEQDKQDETQKNILVAQNGILQAQQMTLASAKIATVTDAADANKLLIAANNKALGDLQAKQADALQKSLEFGVKTTTLEQELAKNNMSAAATMNSVNLGWTQLAIQRDQFAKTYQLEQTRLDLTKQTAADEHAKLPMYLENTKLMIANRLDKEEDAAALKSSFANLNTVAGTNLSVSNMKLTDPAGKSIVADALVGAGQGQLGTSTGNIIEFLGRYGGRITPGLAPMMDKLKGTPNDAATALTQLRTTNPGAFGGKSYNQLAPAERAQLMDSVLDQKITTEMGNRPSTGGLLSPGPLHNTLPAIQAASPVLAEKLAVIASANPLAPTDAQTIFAMQMDRVSKGELTPQAASQELAQVFTFLNKKTYDDNNMHMLAMRPLDSYNTSINTGRGFLGISKNSTYNLADPSQVQNLIMRMKTGGGNIFGQMMPTLPNIGGSSALLAPFQPPPYPGIPDSATDPTPMKDLQQNIINNNSRRNREER